VLAAFPDRVARRRQGSELQLAAGGPAQLAPASTVTTEEFLVAVEAEDRRDRKAPLVRIASGIRPEWLLDLFPERVRETRQVEWNRAAERVESVSALWFDQIAIEESRGIADPEAAAALLASKAMEAGVARFDEIESVDAFLNRARFAAEHGAVPLPDPEAALRELAAGLKSFGELESAARGALVRTMERQLPPPARRLLEEIAPERIKLPRGRSVAVHYEAGQAPWIASRLQDFFGMRSKMCIRDSARTAPSRGSAGGALRRGGARRAGRRDGGISGALRGSRRPRHAPAIPHGRGAHAPPAFRPGSQAGGQRGAR